jgi:hypothetical protein
MIYKLDPNKNDIVFLSASNKMGAVVANLKPKTGRLGNLGSFGGHPWTVMEFRCCNDADLDPKEQNLTTNSA